MKGSLAFSRSASSKTAPSRETKGCSYITGKDWADFSDEIYGVINRPKYQNMLPDVKVSLPANSNRTINTFWTLTIL